MQDAKATGRDTRKAVLEGSIRTNVPLRKTFVQANAGGASRHGPLKEFVTGRDLRGLKAYLLIVAACSNGVNGWSTTRDSLVWARMLDIVETTNKDQSARTGAWRALLRLRARKLIDCHRSGTKITVTLLREDGTGQPYDRPKGVIEEDRYLQIPATFWTTGRDEPLDLPGLAMFLVVAREKNWSSFPLEKAPEWYGWSADTHERGLNKLLALDLVERREKYIKAPLAPAGFVKTYQYKRTAAVQPRKAKKAVAAAP
ncbi:hypothetical protein Snoj_00070 [Streptomyces nojiriensis]|uniref:Replication protein n=2 Tax=Streptomyces nojiriensis TaxID=66374 RepID=A0ABQ3SD81_9ACTN|nr:hypothetical protein JYK04_00013 [Streptomyces nojiriensis]GGS40596.1 hypothetical protein GCM10010205_82370 [Streptomyces nojiriensis]GHI66089.1 hypothetical protein Snoj_00070 [Streptomyces nojiriensis]